ncbi:hypothetical protein FIBSPDRAFT_749593 [Athelia psychrophila]|uniref:Uncharacterized protein n=1 Tax=Athelia psychrophila TaxID=1759441 RepID=A0A166EJC1_9AGAM|nr:hypothetical protein FIBSPDRAFT_749593 [Fibularhizoctonia sp. CBS 109695]
MEGDEVGTEFDGDGEGGEGGEREGPTGGGKPFRKIHGQVYIIDNDEFVTEENEKGNTKIDQYGNLLGGRVYKAATFVLPTRHPNRVYMLAIDAARTSGFRDSLYYFRRNLLALKQNASQPEKEYLIEQGKLGSHLKTRSVTLITARSAFKLHGSKMLIDGRWVTDDYNEEKALEECTSKGFTAGELVGDLTDPAANPDVANNKQSDPAQSGIGSSGIGLYRAGGPTTIFGGSGWGPYSDGPLNAVRKSLLTRDGLNEENWIQIAATRTAEASAEFAKLRREMGKVCGGLGIGMGLDVVPIEDDLKRRAVEWMAEGRDEMVVEVEDEESTRKRRKRNVGDELPLGVYEPHSGVVQYRADTQPTTSRWEVLPDSLERRVLGGTKSGNGGWALAWVDTVLELPSTGETEGDALEAKAREELMTAVAGQAS